MAGKKAVKLSKLPFNELRDKVKTLEGVKTLNRFEITSAVLQAENKPAPAAENPRTIKPEIKAVSARLTAATDKTDKKARRELRRTKARLKRATRRYL